MIAAIFVTALLAACRGPGAQPDATPSTATSKGSPATSTGLAGVDWTAVIDDLDCGQLNRGVEVAGERRADVTGDGTEDALVWVDCVHPTSGWPHQLEVFDGASDPSSPKQIGVLIRDQENLQIRNVSVSGSTVTVQAAAFAENDANCCPSISIRQSFTWDENGFKKGKRTVRQG
jgi:hypothetical protein